MDLSLDESLGNRYRSPSQKARVTTESWIESQLYCPSCSNDCLDRQRHGTKVVDFICSECDEPFQAKSMAHRIGNRILDSAHDAMVEAIGLGECPSLIILQYSREEWVVENLLLIPRHLLGLSAIEKRKPLAETARRAGWTGCNILLDRVPTSGRIYAVKNRIPIDMNAVRGEWSRFSFARGIEPGSRGWVVDVLRCVQSLDCSRFTLQDFYEQFEDELSKLHPQNMNVRAKMRQQLQILRDRGELRFLGEGVYKVV